MIITGEPQEMQGKPFISKGMPDAYIGRVTIEFWREPEGTETDTTEPTFAWIADKAGHLSDEEWEKSFLDGLRKAVQHINRVHEKGSDHRGQSDRTEKAC